jgi:hypothetical protein
MLTHCSWVTIKTETLADGYLDSFPQKAQLRYSCIVGVLVYELPIFPNKILFKEEQSLDYQLARTVIF